MAEARFGWYERVRVATADPAKAAIDGQFGAVVGRAGCDGGGWSYAVFVYAQRRVWACAEDELGPTGEFDRCESLFGGPEQDTAGPADRRG